MFASFLITWTVSLLSRTERLSPSHPCLQDGPCLDTQSSKVPSPAQPPLYDAEGNSHGLLKAPPAAHPGEDYNMNIVACLSRPRPPSASSSQGSPAPLDAPKGLGVSPESRPHSASPHQLPATESCCARLERNVQGCTELEKAAASPGGKLGPVSPPSPGDRGSTPRSEDELTKVTGVAGSGGQSPYPSPTQAATHPLHFEGEGGQGSRAASASSDTTSPSSDPGIEADLMSRNSKAFLPCSPGSDSDVEGEIEAAFTCRGTRVASNMISSISETELDLSSESSSSGRLSHLTNSIEEASSPGSEADLEADLDGQGVIGLKDALLRDPGKDKAGVELPLDNGVVRRETLAALKMEEFYEDPSAPVGQTDAPPSVPLELEINPDHSLESLRRSFYLPVGPKLMPRGDEEEEGNSEYDSESEPESEPDLSEDSDSPWLLSNLVNKMISEGSYPIKCADECFPTAHSLSDTISPASDLEPEIPSEALGDSQPCPRRSIELVDMETLRCSLQRAEQERPTEAKPDAQPRGPYLLMSNPTKDTITPVFPGRLRSGCCKGFSTTTGDPVTLQEDWALDGDVDSGILEDNDLIEDVRLAPSESLDVSTAKTNRCFHLAYSPEEEEPPCLGSLKDSPFSEELPLPPPALALDDSLAYDSIKYTLVVDENTQLELVSLKRCTSVLSDDSDLLRACDAASDLEDAASDFGEGLGVPEGRSSSSEDSSPEADLHFSKKFLNVFVNSTSRSSSKLLRLRLEEGQEVGGGWALAGAMRCPCAARHSVRP